MNQDEVVEAQVIADPNLDGRPVRWRELLAVLFVVALADVTVYRGHGWAGYACLFVGMPLLLLWVRRSLIRSPVRGPFGVMSGAC